DRVQRLMAIHASAQQGKKQIGNIRALPTDFPSLGAPWMLSGLAALAGRSKLVEKLPPLINVLISNVPGPQFPLYFAGAKLLTYYPVSIPAHGGALNMTVQSYNGSLEFGLTACRRAVPDIADRHRGIDAAREALHGALGDARREHGPVRRAGRLRGAEVGGTDEQTEIGGVDGRGLDPYEDLTGCRTGNVAAGQGELELPAGLDERAKLERFAPFGDGHGWCGSGYRHRSARIS
ncbi:MAG TPA: WS/DGAT domain-containing protein, partial [Labilithrix sp.]|nr:WS/DGAT domain-containing protein [Labilithrix sp.]